jgi:hypothetical protein
MDTELSNSASAVAAEKILHMLQGIRYGSIEIVIHDSRIVQIERKEKVRFDVPNTERH